MPQQPFLSINYDGEEYPNAEEHSLMGYDPNRIFLSNQNEEVEMAENFTASAENMREFFSELNSVALVFRYKNGRAVRDLQETPKDEIDEFRTAPAYSFGLAEAELDPNYEWMEKLGDLEETVSEYGLDEIKFEGSEEPEQRITDLEEGLQDQPLHVVPDIQGVADLKYNFETDTAEVKVYSDNYLLKNSFGNSDMRDSLLDIPRHRSWRAVRYRVDRDEILSLKNDLEEEVENVEINQLSQNVMPPEIQKQL